MEETVEGIVLRSQPYREKARIITLFTPLGVMSLIVKRMAPRYLSLTTPFSHGEYQIVRGRSDLFALHDATLLHEHLELRSSLTHLRVAGALAQGILRSQWPLKGSPALFTLYKAYHQRVASCGNPQALLASFYLKALRLEGILTLEDEEMAPLLRVDKFSDLETVVVSEVLLERVEQLFSQLIE